MNIIITEKYNPEDGGFGTLWILISFVSGIFIALFGMNLINKLCKIVEREFTVKNVMGAYMEILSEMFFNPRTPNSGSTSRNKDEIVKKFTQSRVPISKDTTPNETAQKEEIKKWIAPKETEKEKNEEIKNHESKKEEINSSNTYSMIKISSLLKRYQHNEINARNLEIDYEYNNQQQSQPTEVMLRKGNPSTDKTSYKIGSGKILSSSKAVITLNAEFSLFTNDVFLLMSGETIAITYITFELVNGDKLTFNTSLLKQETVKL